MLFKKYWDCVTVPRSPYISKGIRLRGASESTLTGHTVAANPGKTLNTPLFSD